MKFLTKYWAQITGILTMLVFLFCWCWRLATKFDSVLLTVQQHTEQLASHQQMLDDHDETLDEQDHRLIPLEVKENLREQKLMK